MDQEKERVYGMSFSNEVNMTNCYKHCKHFFERCKSIHFNVLIAYWMMAGYLGRVDSVEEAYEKGHQILLRLTNQEKRMLKPSDKDPEMIEFISTDSEPIPCKHERFCFTENLGFVDLVELVELGNGVVFTDGILKTVPKSNEEQQMIPSSTTTKNQLNGSVLLIDGNHLSRQVFHPPRKLEYLAYFEPKPDSLNPLLKKVTWKLSVLLLRDCDKLQEIDFPLEKFKNLTVLEISGLSLVKNMGSIPLDKIPGLTQLQCLNLSDLLIEKLPDEFFSNLLKLKWVIFRGCSKLVSLPSIKSLKNLEALDLSYCSALKEFKSTTLQFPQLQMLDLSCTGMLSVPALKDTHNLTHLFLRDVKVSVLNSLKQLTSLQVLDLSGAHNVKQIDQFKGNKNIEVLNLSKIGIESIDFLTDLIHLRDLILRECTSLKRLPAMKELRNIEVLDISGCKNLTDLPADLTDLKSLKELNLSGCTCLKELRMGILDQMSCLLKLDLSGTKFDHLPSFANLTSLCRLSLRGLELDSLDSLASLSTLVDLDLDSLKISSSQEFIFDFIQSSEKLQILNLSHTSVAKLANLSKLVSLRELLLAHCQHLKSVSGLQTLTNLEILDLSLQCQIETEFEGQIGFYLPVPNRLRKLVLTNRFGVQQLFPMTSLSGLEYLDLRGTDVTKIPNEIMAQVKCIQLPSKIDLSGVLLSRMGVHQETIDWKDSHPGHLQGGISNDTEIQIVSALGNKSFMSAGANQFFHLKESGKQGYWEAFIHQFSVSVPPIGSEDKVIYLDGDEFILRDNLSWARRLQNLELQGRSVEIHGFSGVPDDIHNILKQPQADNVAFVGNDFLVSLSNICSKAMKVCCIRKCQKMKSVLSGEEKKGIIPNCLVLLDLVALEFIYAANMSPESIASLKHLHIDCCPNLTKVIIASSIPENLDTLHIKFCNKLQTLFEENVTLSNLQKLSLFELTGLESINAELPCLKCLSISQCPKLKNLDTAIRSATSLTQLCLDSCSGLVTLFDNTDSSSSPLPKLKNLQTLRLRNLPKLKSIGGELSVVSAPDFDPSLPSSVIQQLRFP